MYTLNSLSISDHAPEQKLMGLSLSSDGAFEFISTAFNACDKKLYNPDSKRVGTLRES